MKTIAMFIAYFLLYFSVFSQPLYQLHWSSSSESTFGGSGGATLSQTIDTACSYISLSVADTANATLPAFSPLTINPFLPGGTELTDLSGNMSFHVRVRSQHPGYARTTLAKGQRNESLACRPFGPSYWDISDRNSSRSAN